MLRPTNENTNSILHNNYRERLGYLSLSPLSQHVPCRNTISEVIIIALQGSGTLIKARAPILLKSENQYSGHLASVSVNIFKLKTLNIV